MGRASARSTCCEHFQAGKSFQWIVDKLQQLYLSHQSNRNVHNPFCVRVIVRQFSTTEQLNNLQERKVIRWQLHSRILPRNSMHSNSSPLGYRIPAIGTDDNIRSELAKRELIRFVVNDASLESSADLFGANSDTFYVWWLKVDFQNTCRINSHSIVGCKVDLFIQSLVRTHFICEWIAVWHSPFLLKRNVSQEIFARSSTGNSCYARLHQPHPLLWSLIFHLQNSRMFHRRIYMPIWPKYRASLAVNAIHVVQPLLRLAARRIQ